MQRYYTSSFRSQNVDNMTVMEIAIKISDIGHCAKRLPLHLKWTERITEEFWQQVRVDVCCVLGFV